MEMVNAINNDKRDATYRRLSRYVKGDGWTFTPNVGFTFGEHLEQIGGSCVIYGVMNLLIHEGIDISPERAEELRNKMATRYGVREGFSIKAAKDILDEYGWASIFLPCSIPLCQYRTPHLCPSFSTLKRVDD